MLKWPLLVLKSLCGFWARYVLRSCGEQARGENEVNPDARGSHGKMLLLRGRV